MTLLDAVLGVLSWWPAAWLWPHNAVTWPCEETTALFMRLRLRQAA